MSNVATIEQKPAARSVLVDMATRYGMEPAAFEQTLRATVVPKDCTKEQFASFLLVAKEYKLNPVLKEIFAFPTRGGGIQPIVSIDGWMNLINSHPAADGIEFDDALNDKGELVSVTARIWRKDRSHPVAVTEYMAECRRNTDTWKTWPRRMLRHKAAIQAARYAFGFAGIVDPDEAERDAPPARDVTPPRAPSPAPAPARAIAGPPPAPVRDDDPPHDPDTGEIADKLLPATESAQLKKALLGKLAKCSSTGEVEKFIQANAAGAATLQPGDREELQAEWDARSAELYEREQAADAGPLDPEG